jgi:hypothetical protein
MNLNLNQVNIAETFTIRHVEKLLQLLESSTWKEARFDH